MTFGEDWGWGASEAECARMLEAFAAAGGNIVDTANAYTNGASERILGRLIAPERDRWVVSTKYAVTQDPTDPNAGGTHRKSLVRALEDSLERLGTDYVDVYWVHVWDVFTPVEEVVQGLDDIVRAGKALYVGISDTPAWLVAQAVTLADLRGWARFAGLQAPYSLIERSAEADLLPMARALDLSVTTWEALGGGLLTGRYGTDREPPEGTRLSRSDYGVRLTDRNLVIADAVNRVAAERGAEPAQVAIAWVLAQRDQGVIVPLVGARSAEQLAVNLAAVDLELEPRELELLDDASRPVLGFPHDFPGRAMAYGDTYRLIDGHRPRAWSQIA
jgi:aryl-alcohol dehydrogenase-like predicted oxidoreductase